MLVAISGIASYLGHTLVQPRDESGLILPLETFDVGGFFRAQRTLPLLDLPLQPFILLLLSDIAEIVLYYCSEISSVFQVGIFFTRQYVSLLSESDLDSLYSPTPPPLSPLTPPIDL